MAMLTTDNALWPSALVSVTATASSVNVVTRLISTTVTPSAAATADKDDPAAESIDEAADADGTGRADERRPQIQLRVVHTPDAEIAEEWLGDEPKTLRAPRERADHGGSRDKQHNPAVIERFHCGWRGVVAVARWI